MRIRKESGIMSDTDLEEIALIADALAHPLRLELFRYIMQHNKNMDSICNGDLVEHFDYAQATISQHMKKLIISGLVDTRKKDKFTYYYANLGVLMKFINLAKRYAII